MIPEKERIEESRRTWKLTQGGNRTRRWGGEEGKSKTIQ